MNILFCDLETTGLDPTKGLILEFYGELYEMDRLTMKHVASFEKVFNIIQGVFERQADAVVQEMHTKSGLLADCVKSSQYIYNFDAELARQIPEKTILAGASIHFDRKWIDLQMPELSKRLHYRMIDVTSLKITDALSTARGEVYYEKIELPAHRAKADTQFTITEFLRFVKLFNGGMV